MKPAAARLYRIADNLASGRLPNADDAEAHAAALRPTYDTFDTFDAFNARFYWPHDDAVPGIEATIDGWVMPPPD